MLQQKKEFYTSLIEVHGDMIYRYALIHMRSYAEAQDLYQDVFLKLFEKEPELRDVEHAKAWLLRVCINLCKNRLRFRLLHPQKELEEAWHVTDEKQDLQLISYLKQLPAHYRDALYFFYYEGYTTKEIAALLHTKDTTVRTWLSRGKQQLKELLLKEGETYEEG